METKNIRALIAKGELGNALEAAAANDSLNQDQQDSILLLTGRFNKLEQELSRSTRSQADYDLEYSRISDALIDTLQRKAPDNPFHNQANPKSVPYRQNAPTQSAAANKWLWAVSGAFALLVFFFILGSVGGGGTTTPTENYDQETHANSMGVATPITVPKLSMLLFDTPDGTSSAFTLMKGEVIATAGDEQTLRFDFRCVNNHNFPINFYDNGFRFMPINSPPYAPNSGLNEVVEGNSFKDGVVQFTIPADIRSGNIIVTSYEGEQNAILLEW